MFIYIYIYHNQLLILSVRDDWRKVRSAPGSGRLRERAPKGRGFDR